MNLTVKKIKAGRTLVVGFPTSVYDRRDLEWSDDVISSVKTLPADAIVMGRDEFEQLANNGLDESPIDFEAYWWKIAVVLDEMGEV